MSTEQKKNRYYEWVGQMQFLSLLIGEKFEEPIKEDGTKEDDIDILWDFYINYNKRRMEELAGLRAELRGE
jgi:hypothetical protein